MSALRKTFVGWRPVFLVGYLSMASSQIHAAPLLNPDGGMPRACEAVGGVAEQRVLVERLGKAALQYGGGDLSRYAELEEMAARFEGKFTTMKVRAVEGAEVRSHRDPNALPPSAQSDLARAEGRWKRVAASLQAMRGKQGGFAVFYQAVRGAEKNVMAMLPRLDELASGAAGANLSPDQVYVATRQLFVAQRMVANLRLLATEEGEEMVDAVDRIGRDSALMERILTAQISGDKTMGVERLANGKLRGQAEALLKLNQPVREEVHRLLNAVPAAFVVRSEVQAVVVESAKLGADLAALSAAWNP